MDIHSILVPIIACAGASKQELKAAKLLTSLLATVQDQYVSSLLAMDGSTNSLILGARLLATQGLSVENTEQVRAAMTDTLVKTVLTSKTKVAAESLRQAGPFLRLLSHQQFKEELLPVISKALLRSPETALSAVGAVLAGLSLDLSVYVAELGKTFATSLRSKDDTVRDDALAATLALGKQCSDPSSVQLLLAAVFAVLNGSEGKIGLATTKASLLAACGGLSSSAVTGGGLAELADSATQQFVKFLETETHEGTLVLALEQLAVWAARYSNSLPPALVAWFPKGMALKTTSSSVRAAYLLLLSAALHTNTLASALPLVPSLTKVVDSAVKQSAQVAMLSEGAHAAACLVRIAEVDLATETGLQDFFSLVTDMEKQLFYSDKFLASAGAAALQSVASLATALLVSHVDKVGPAPAPLLRVLATCLLAGCGGVRRHALREVGRVGSSLGGAATVCSLLGEVCCLLHSRSVLLESSARTEAPPGREEPASGDIPASAATAGSRGFRSFFVSCL